MKAIAVALAFLDFAPVFFLALGLFFLAQLVDRLDPRCRRLAFAGLVLITIAGLARAASNLEMAFSGREIPVLAASLYVFGGPGFTLMAAALIRGRATALGQRAKRDPWIVPTVISWLSLMAAFYLNTLDSWSGAGSRALLFLALVGMAVTSLVATHLGLKRQLHMAAGLFALSLAGTGVVVGLRALASQPMWIQLLAVILNLTAQAAFAFAAWRVAAEYQARIGPTAPTP